MLLAPWLIGAAVAFTEVAPPACELDGAPPGAPELYLITASPGAQPFTFVGHASVWLRDPQRGLDHVWEFGVIDSRKQEPLSSLLLGTLVCTWHVPHVRREIRDYRRLGRTAVAHRLHLPAESEERVIAELLAIRADPDRPYRFDWRRNSCATRVRDILDEALSGALQRAWSTPAALTPREEVLRHVAPVGWAWLGLQLLGGADTDRPQSQWEAGFIPLRLAQNLAETPLGRGGSPLAAEPCTLHAGEHPWPAPAPPQRGLWMALIGLTAGGGMAGLAGWGRRRRAPRVLGGLVYALLGALLGLIGLVELALWSLSTLPDFGPKQSSLLISPFSAVLVPLGLAWAVGRRPGWGRVATRALVALAGLSLLGCLLPLSDAEPIGLVLLLGPVLVASVRWAASPTPAHAPTAGGEGRAGGR